MAKTQTVFARYEKKYVLSFDKYAKLIERLSSYMTLDEYGKYTICNIYYDTDNYELIRHSLQKPSYKEKLRIRSYGVAKDDAPVFIELKKKVNGIVYKRRTIMTCAIAMDYMNRGVMPKDEQIRKEISWFMHRYDLTKKTYIAYDRMAYFGKDNPDLRITFDFDLRYRMHHCDLRYQDSGEAIMEHHEVLMEIKMPFAMPIWLSNILNELEIYPCSFSKYGVCYKEHIFEHEKTGGFVYV